MYTVNKCVINLRMFFASSTNYGFMFGVFVRSKAKLHKQTFTFCSSQFVDF